MEPSIGRSIGEGFRAANKSWPGIGLMAGSWVLVGLFVVLAVALTRVPEELFRQTAEAPTEVPPAATPSSPLPPTPIPPEATAPTKTPSTSPAPEAGQADLFKEMAKTGEAARPVEEAAAAALKVTPKKDTAREEQARQERIMDEWFQRAWPMLLFCALLMIAANLWISGGQLGYLAKRITAQQSSVSDFLRAGARSFGKLLGASLISLAVVGAIALVIGLFAVAGGALARVAPTWLLGILAALLILALMVTVVWLAVRLSFWFIAIVADGVGPIAGLKISLRTTRGRWWKLAGLGLVMALISYGIWLPFGLLDWASGFIGGATAMILGILSNLCAVLASLFIGFVTLAAYIRFYEDTKPTPSPARVSVPAA